MCGIVSMFSRRDPISEVKLERATQSLYHRGPDGQRHWISGDRRVALGHARLSIIDLMTGDQPIASEGEAECAGKRYVAGAGACVYSFFRSEKVIGLLDSVGDMDEGSRVANDQVLMMLVSACVLQEGFI